MFQAKKKRRTNPVLTKVLEFQLGLFLGVAEQGAGSVLVVAEDFETQQADPVVE